MKIWLMIGVVFAVLALMKLYAFSVLRHTFIFEQHKVGLALLLIALYATELAFFFLAKDKGFDHTTYIALSSSVILAYSLFVASLVGDVSLRAGRFVLDMLETKPKVESTKDLHKDSVLDSTREAESIRAESAKTQSAEIESIKTQSATTESMRTESGLDSNPTLKATTESMGIEPMRTESSLNATLDSASKAKRESTPAIESTQSSPAITTQDTQGARIQAQGTHAPAHSKRESRLDSVIESKAHSVLDSNRRRFLKILRDLGIVTLFLLFSFRSARNALSIPKVRDVEVRLRGLARDMSIAMISDVHIGKMLQSEFVRGIVERINALNADIVVIVGDLVDEDIAFVKEHLLLLNELQSKEGVYYVNGNHEYYHGIDSITDFLHTLKLKVLENESVELESVNLCGVNDLAGESFAHRPPDLEAAKSGRNPNKPSILLAHQPKFVRRNDVSEFDLVLCGHTHAGQVFPLSIFVWLDQHYIHGLYRLDSSTQLYVSSGAGFWGPAIRFLAPSEIVHLRLRGD